MESSRAGGGAPAVAGESPGDQVTVFCGHHREASQLHPATSRQWSQDVASGAGAVTLTPCHE